MTPKHPDNIIEDVEQIKTDRGYWFVRTDSGANFDTFYENEFIGIGWDEVTKDDIVKHSIVEVKNKIAKHNGLDLTTVSGKSKITAIYNKILRFNSIKKNDIVVIPSAASSRLAFGIVVDDELYYERGDLKDCSYRKRRKIKWIKKVHISALDTIFYKIVPSRHAISSIKKYENYIDNVTNALYQKEGYTHFVLHVTKEGDIDFDALLGLMGSIKELSSQINDYFRLEEDKEALSIKVNVQSPGWLEFKRKIGISVMAMAMIFSSCTNNDPIGDKTIDGKPMSEFVTQHQDTVNKIDSCIRDLQIKINTMNNN